MTDDVLMLAAFCGLMLLAEIGIWLDLKRRHDEDRRLIGIVWQRVDWLEMAKPAQQDAIADKHLQFVPKAANAPVKMMPTQIRPVHPVTDGPEEPNVVSRFSEPVIGRVGPVDVPIDCSCGCEIAAAKKEFAEGGGIPFAEVLAKADADKALSLSKEFRCSE